MLDDSFTNLKGEIQAGKIGIALLKYFHNAQRVQIVIETFTERAHELVQAVLACMPKRRVADVVNERQRLRQVGVQIESAGNRARDLRHFQRVREAITKVI